MLSAKGLSVLEDSRDHDPDIDSFQPRSEGVVQKHLEHWGQLKQVPLPTVALSHPKDKLPAKETRAFNALVDPPAACNQDYTRDIDRENALCVELSQLKKSESEVTGTRETFFEEYSQLSAEEMDLINEDSNIQRRNHEIEACFGHLHKEMMGSRSQIEKKETDLGNCRRALFTGFERNYVDLEQLKGQHEKERAEIKQERVELKKALEIAGEKILWQICLENAKNTLILPCTHYLYCNDCLLLHQKTLNTCPLCRGTIAALLICKLG